MARASEDLGPAINVTMDGGRIVIRPSGPLDDDDVSTMRSLLAGARAAGASAVVDLSLIDVRHRAEVLSELGRDTVEPAPVCVA